MIADKCQNGSLLLPIKTYNAIVIIVMIIMVITIVDLANYMGIILCFIHARNTAWPHNLI